MNNIYNKMKKLILSLSIGLISASLLLAGGYSVGDKASDFKLENVDGEYVSLSDFEDAKGYIVVFTCNNCPYAKAYQDRIIKLDEKYKPMGYPVIAINPNNTDVKPDDDMSSMKSRAEDKGYTFPYLKDTDYKVYKEYGATRTPHIFVLTKDKGDLKVSYIGAIDDNYQDASAVNDAYLANAVDALLANGKPDPSFTKAIGCSIK